MTGPVWMALPPEVHSALLVSGPGPESLLAAAAAWQSLSSEYASTAADLASVLSAVQAGVWQGPSAEEYVGAHAPFLAWLAQASGKSAATAAQHEAAATAYTTALAAMPTLAELAANHVVHGVLVATNFFGINTIPIAVNEADYVRMWIQAATTMSTYETLSNAATSGVPATAVAPMVLKSDATDAAAANQVTAAAPAADSGSQLNLVDLITEFLQGYSNLVQQIYAPITSFLQDPVGNTVKLITLFLTNPQEALVVYGPFLFAVAYQAFSWVGASLTYPQLLLDPLLGMTLGIVLGAAQQFLAQAPAAAAAAGTGLVPFAQAAHPSTWPVVGLAPTTVASPVGASVASAAGSAGTAPAPAAPAAPATALAYAVGGFDPDEGFTPTLGGRGGVKAPAVGVPAAAVGVSAREKRRSRRRRKATLPEHQYADEFMDYDDGPESNAGAEPFVAASSAGAGVMGFGGTAEKRDVDASGLITLPADAFGGGPTRPMLPTTWGADR
ncbi:MAG: PPE family protein [Mycobacterium sp.]|uniref:PPE family protein n=1 Tax=Mycobacterium sp. TaxID=1785 RepID=UPI001ED0A567|nr:PPE family protein [Mycobacterium sp.]MBW0016938.1 PPE family protein [Mycobacterium sp.]